MRPENAGLTATIAFMLCVCAITIGWSLLIADDPAPSLRPTIDDTPPGSP